jgi:opacity protein-like surface antigen
LYAGGDIAPVEEPIAEIPVVVDDSAFYFGLGYGILNQTNGNIVVATARPDIEYNVDTAFVQAGYMFNKYLAVEGRFWYGVNDLTETIASVETKLSGDYSAWGIYVKPMYPITDSINIYALIGYGSVKLAMDNGEKWDTDGLSYGAGLSFNFTKNLSIFADYIVVAYNNEFEIVDAGVIGKSDINTNTINIGVSYSF